MGIVRGALAGMLLWCGMTVHASELHGEAEFVLGTGSGQTGSTQTGLGKNDFDGAVDPWRNSSATLTIQTQLFDEISGWVTFSADGERSQVLDVQEAWLAWKPVPSGPWRTRIRLGSFFPPTSLEIEPNSPSWKPVRTLSSSAINTWIGEELRSNGLELAFSRRGLMIGSPHDFDFTLAAISANDPAGTLLAWRGWTFGDRITGLTETLRLPDLPVYRPDGPIPRQTRNVREFRDIDGVPGYYASASYTYAHTVQVSFLHYDNEGHPLDVVQGQYSWETRFNHLSVQVLLPAGWEILSQAIQGTTLMGADAVHVRFRALYLLASHPFGPGDLTLRWDLFRTQDIDLLPTDPNSEHGNALALAYRLPLGKQLHWVSEFLWVDSTRAAHILLGEPTRAIERSLSTALRWDF
ncbi:MAG TPA: hypothetical protein VGM97_10965 [Steroidobacteraceae bacterium]|jgi:hypothetical protein